MSTTDDRTRTERRRGKWISVVQALVLFPVYWTTFERDVRPFWEDKVDLVLLEWPTTSMYVREHSQLVGSCVLAVLFLLGVALWVFATKTKVAKSSAGRFLGHFGLILCYSTALGLAGVGVVRLARAGFFGWIAGQFSTSPLYALTTALIVLALLCLIIYYRKNLRDVTGVLLLNMLAGFLTLLVTLAAQGHMPAGLSRWADGIF